MAGTWPHCIMPWPCRRAMETRSEVDEACVAFKARDVANPPFLNLFIFNADPVTKGFLQHCCWLCHPSVTALGARCLPAWCGAPPALQLSSHRLLAVSVSVSQMPFRLLPASTHFLAFPQCPHPSLGASGSRMPILAANLVAIHQPQCCVCPSVLPPSVIQICENCILEASFFFKCRSPTLLTLFNVIFFSSLAVEQGASGTAFSCGSPPHPSYHLQR